MEKITVALLLIALAKTAVAVNTCISEGKFIADYNCTSYEVCAKTDTQIMGYTIPCPPGFNVRHQDMVCTISGNKCEPSYNCTVLGDFRNPNNVNAASYISCIQGSGDMIIALNMECTAPLEFSAELGICAQKIALTTTQPVTVVASATPGTASEFTINGRAEAITEVNPSTTQKIAQKMPSSSTVNLASCVTILATALFYYTLI